MVHFKTRVVATATKMCGLAPEDVRSRKLSPALPERATFPMEVNARTQFFTAHVSDNPLDRVTSSEYG